MGIEIQNVTKRFGATTALNNISLSLAEDHIYGLLGNNGAGKTTLLSIIANRIYADGGSVTVDGMPAEDNDAALGRVFLMGDTNLFPDDMRVKKAFETAALFYPEFDLSGAMALSERFGLNVKKKIVSLSTGYATIFRLIMALSTNAPYLLLDEPVLGLDAQHRDLFYQLLVERFARGGQTVVLSTHLIAEVEALVDHAIIIRDGDILRDAPKDDLLAGCYTVSGPAAAVDAYTGGKLVLTENALGGLKTACLQGVPVEAIPEGLVLGKPNLQDYFINLMNAEDQQK